jgi:hypothetical protein
MLDPQSSDQPGIFVAPGSVHQAGS